MPPKAEAEAAYAGVASGSDCTHEPTNVNHACDLFARHILLVEDDALLALDLHEEFIGREADVIGPVGDLERAYELAESDLRIDAAVIDINLHGEFAFHLADELIRRNVVVVFSTGYDQDVVPYALRHIPCYLKPVPASEIAQGIADLIAERQSREISQVG